MKVVYIKFVRNKPFYVGEGTPEREQKSGARNKVWKDSIGDADHVCSLVVSTHTDKVGSKLQEQGFIRWFGQRILNDGPLTNILPWGDVGDHKEGAGKCMKEANARGGRKRRGLLWWNDGVNEQKSRQSPGPQWTRGRSPKLKRSVSRTRSGQKLGPKTDDTKQKQSDARKGFKWWTNGIKSTCSPECPENWWPGRSRRRTS